EMDNGRPTWIRFHEAIGRRKHAERSVDHAMSADARRPAASAGIGGRARAALQQVTAPVGYGSAVQVELHARLRCAARRTALPWCTAAAAGLRRDTVAALEQLAAAVARRAAGDTERGARRWRAHWGRGRHVRADTRGQIEDHELEQL